MTYREAVPIKDVTREAVLAAVAECDAMSREAFLQHYGFKPAKTYFLVHGGRSYDSKAIIGAAHRHVDGHPLAAASFSGGEVTVARRLRTLGFHVRTEANPDWAYEELVLACDLVKRAGWRGLRASDPRVGELSELLQRLPIHDLADRATTFRNRNSVARKSYDIATWHRDYTGKRTRGGQLDREVLAAFLENPDEMSQRAERIRSNASVGAFDNLIPVDAEELAEIEAPEGKLFVRQHLTRERSLAMRQRKIDRVRAEGRPLSCAACGFDFEETYGERGEGYIECHHIVPLHTAGERTTRLHDLVLVCSNCHRMIHRRSPWLTPAELEELLARDGNGQSRSG